MATAVNSFLTPAQFESIYTDEIKPYYEYWFGKAIPKSTPTLSHGVMQVTVGMFLMRNGWRTATELRLKLSKVAFPVPDIAANRKPFHGPYPTEPFDLCVEILSPGDPLDKLFDKCAHYLDWGIGSVWLIDPDGRMAYSMTIENPQPLRIDISGVLTAGSGSSGLILSMSDLFAEFDRNLG